MKKFVFVLVLLAGNFAHAHGDGHGPEREKKISKKEQAVRSNSLKLGIIESQVVQTILDGEKVPSDVLLVRCNLSDSVPCRGLSISLSGKNGEKLLTAHSGSDGWVGFQGLSPDATYEVKIESEKYRAVGATSSGTIHRLYAERFFTGTN